MPIPGEPDLRSERQAIVETMESLTDEEFESGPTLCTEWAPRDILAHLLGADSQLFEYAKKPLKIDAANAAIVDKARTMSRERLLHRARHWAEKPAPHARLGALFFLSDESIHHQDVLRGLGRTRAVPEASAAAILRGGMGLAPRTLLSFRVVPTDGGRSLGRGPNVRGTSEALGLWLAGRAGIEPELEFDR